jgi:phage tail sheath protein FI
MEEVVMPQRLGSPGVYIEEVPSGRRVIRSVATSIGAFVDFFREGPMNTPVRIFGTGDFERVFGGHDTRSEASFAIPQFFLNGGPEAWVVRVASGNFAEATRNLADENAADILTVNAANPGVWGNTLRVEIDHAVTDSDPNDLRFNMRVVRFASTAGNAPGLLAETFLNLSMDETNARFVETIVNDESQLVQVDVIGDLDGTVRPAANGTVGGQLPQDSVTLQPLLDALGGGQTLDLVAGTATATATLTWDPGTVTTQNQLRGRVEAAIRAADPGIPAFAGARVTLENSRLRLLSGRSGAAYTTDDTITVAGTSTAAGLDLSGGNEVVSAQQYDLRSGNDGALPTPTEIIGSNALEPPTGMFALDDVDLFNILCLPGAAELSSDTERNAVYSNAISYCEERRAMCIVDIPPGTNTLTDMTDLMADMETAGLRSSYAAVFYPRLRIPDPTDDFRLRDVGASGTMAGVFARTDTARGVWKAPAGIDTGLEGVSELDAQVNDGQNGVLNPLGINALRTFPVYGTIAWGTRTMDGADALASEWAYIPVRRLALMLEESLFRGTQWVVFEPNDEPTWANIRMNVGAFMNGLFQQGAFQGATPRDAYYVKCDSETTTQNDIDQGVVNIEVGFAPLKPAEFVVIRFRQIVGQVEV